MRGFTERLRRSLNRTAARVALLVTAAVLAVFAMPSAAMAEANFYQDCEYDWAICEFGVGDVLVNGSCMTTDTQRHSTSVCIGYDGDYVYVRDGKADGYGAVGYVYSEDGVRDRYCANNKGYGTWVRCDFNWTEATRHFASGGYIEQYYIKETVFLWEWSGK